VALARVGLGSNVGDAVANVERAFEALRSLGRVIERSSLYRTKAWGVADQADFVNAAALLETELEPRELLGGLKAIERQLGRVPAARWGPRVIDLDILAYDQREIRERDLVIPHQRLFERAFALAPLAEIDPAFEPAHRNLPEGERRTVERIGEQAARSPLSVNWDQTLERVRAAAAFCEDSGLVRFRIEEDGLTIDLRRTPHMLAPSVAAETAVLHAGSPIPAGNGVVMHEGGPATNVLKAEFVGIVRFSRPAVNEGAPVDEDRELAYVEALGIRNPVRPGGPGRVVRIFVIDGQPVEYGQPLFSIEEE
jgi:2-amino-4-hydroxy-6-hydroxymethyldihydropteridine diphosphokinase